MITFTSLIVHQNNSFFRFQSQKNSWVCDVCYWHGEVTLLGDTSLNSEPKESVHAVEKSGSPIYRAIATQKYPPFISMEQEFHTLEEGLNWIAFQLSKDREKDQ